MLFYPCVDLTNETEQLYSSKAIAGHGRDLSPLYHLRAGLPPIMIFQGSDDPLLAENRRYCDGARALGNVCDWSEYPGAKHGFFVKGAPPAAGWYDKGLAAMDTALVRRGYLPPTLPADQ